MATTSNKVIIITDSVACLTSEIINRYKIIVVPVNIYFNSQLYRDGKDLTIQEAYRMLEKDPQHFASSPASIGEYLDVYKEVARYSSNILVITISSKLSTLNNVTKLARDEARDLLPDINIEIIDSGTATVGEGLIVTSAARAAEENKSLDEVLKTVRETSSRIRVMGILDTVRYVYRTGRIPELPARLGSMLNIKPIFSITESAIQVKGIAMQQSKGLEKIIREMRKVLGANVASIAIAHTEDVDTGNKLLKRLESEFNCAEIWLTDFSPVMAYATGPKALAIAFYAWN